MGHPIPDAATVAAKWSKNAGNAVDEYVTKVKGSTWKTEAVAGEDNYKTAMTTVISKELRKKGVEKSSDTVWQGGVEKNKDRYGTGVRDNQDKMQTGINPVLTDIKSAISDARYPKKGPKGASSNYDRSKFIGSKLHDESLKRHGAV